MQDEPEAADVAIRLSAEHRGIELLHAPAGVSVLIDNCGIWCWLVEPGAANTDERRSAGQAKRDAMEMALTGQVITFRAGATSAGPDMRSVTIGPKHAAKLVDAILKAGAA